VVDVEVCECSRFVAIRGEGSPRCPRLRVGGVALLATIDEEEVRGGDDITMTAGATGKAGKPVSAPAVAGVDVPAGGTRCVEVGRRPDLHRHPVGDLVEQPSPPGRQDRSVQRCRR
jgi:hypothetical protein